MTAMLDHTYDDPRPCWQSCGCAHHLSFPAGKYFYKDTPCRVGSTADICLVRSMGEIAKPASRSALSRIVRTV